MWGGGCHATPVMKEELFNHIQEFGWPSTEQVYDAELNEVRVPANRSINFGDFSGYNLWGIGRQARNIDRDSVPNPMQFDLIEKGLMNYLGHLGHAASEAGDVMLVIQGVSTESPEQHHRFACLISGTTWNPKVCDVTVLDFAANVADETQEILTLPCDVRVATRKCLVCPKYEAILTLTSDEWILILVRALGRMQLYRATYEVICPDGTLMWSRIAALEEVGTLWCAEMRKPLSFAGGGGGHDEHEQQQKLLRKMNKGDPLSDAAARQRATTRPRATGQRGRGAGRGRGGGRGRAGAHGSMVDSLLDGEGPAVEAVRRPAHVPLHDVQGSLPEPAVHTELDVDEDDVSSVNSVEELEAAFGLLEASATEFPHNSVEEGLFGDDDDDAPADSATCAQLLELVHSVSCDIGLNPPGSDDLAASSSSGVAAPALLAPAPTDVGSDPWNLVSDPSPLGYCHLGIRHVLRIQRGKPKGSVSVTCYRHRACTLLLSESRAPADIEFKKWLFEVDATPQGATTADNRALALQHTALGKARWSAKAMRQ
jgi:hypothetical protein